MNGGTYLEPNKTTVAAFLARWLEHLQDRISPKAHERYGEIVHKNIIPLIGGVLLNKLRPPAISDAYAAALSNGRRDGKGGLAPSTVVYMHRLLKQALAKAVTWDLIVKNPVDAVAPPRVERKVLRTYDLAETADLLAAVSSSRLRTPIALAVQCGMRRGEVCALRWRHVDLAAAQISVAESAEQTRAGVRYKPPKSGKARTVAIPASLAEELRVHRLRQAEEFLFLGMRPNDDTFVYTREDGAPLQPRSLTHSWQEMVKASGLPRIRFHDLRHAHATHMLSSGVHPKVASERLGHSRVGITLDLYSHVLPGMQEEAAARVDDALRIAVERRAAKSIG